MSFIVGLDLGQTSDPSALCVLDRKEVAAAAGESVQAQYSCRAMKRWPLGTPYTALVKELGELLGKPELRDAVLCVDATGVGRPVVDLIREAKLAVDLVPVVITAGLSESEQEDGSWHVAKVVLISGVQVVLQSRRLRFARGLPETGRLVRELENYRVKITPAANESFNAREGEHDDLVLALALAVWYGERMVSFGPGSIGMDRATATGAMPPGVFRTGDTLPPRW